MLSIGEFSKICNVSTKTLRYYAEIGLILPEEINPENGYRYYSITQLEIILFINRLKSYHFSLEEIKNILKTDISHEKLYRDMYQKKQEIIKQSQILKTIMDQLDNDIINLKQGKSIMSYLEDIEVQLVEAPELNLLSIRKNVQEVDFPQEYEHCFSYLLRKITIDKLTISAPPMVLFHQSEFDPYGLDTEFAIPIKEYVTKTRDFKPGLCLKTIVHGTYLELSSIYTKQHEWAEKEGYMSHGVCFEVYVNDPTLVEKEEDLITEVYLQVKKK